MPDFRILFIGDVVGHAGRLAVGSILPELREQYSPQFVIANGENLAGGLGLTKDTADELFSYGVNLLTTGNHVWDKKEILSFIDSYNEILRPANYPHGVPGRGYAVLDVELCKSSIKFAPIPAYAGIPKLVDITRADAGNQASRIAVFNLSGRIFMEPLDDPFAVANDLVSKLKGEAKIIILDFHAEATSEKIAMGWYLDGKVSAVIGTHTHVQTADETILPNGTAYITDVGMTGPVDSVLGIEKELIIRKFLTRMPVKFEVAKGDVMVCAVIIDIDPATGGAKSIERLQRIVKR